MNLQPTSRFQWRLFRPADLGTKHPTAIKQADGLYYMVLQQWWTDTYGRGEWRDVRMEYGDDPDRFAITEAGKSYLENKNG